MKIEDTPKNAAVVMKFGGTSVATPERWTTIANMMQREQDYGRKPFVVCSALSGVTNKLETLIAACEEGGDTRSLLSVIRGQHEQLAKDLGISLGTQFEFEWNALTERVESCRAGESVPAHLKANMLAAGERLSTRLGAQWLNENGYRVRWKDVTEILDSITIPESNDEQHFLASPCNYNYKPELAKEFLDDSAEAWITQGFTARDDQGRTVLLGRGGSDTSAACLAATIGAEELQIWTDVPGLFTSNPRDIDDVRLLKFATYNEAESLASLGAKVLHPRCLEPVRDANIPVRICWTKEPYVEGTVIEADSDREKRGFKAVTSRSDICLLRMKKPASWQPVGFMKDVATCFEELGLSMDLLSSSPSEIRATVDLSAFPGFHELEASLRESLGKFCEVEVFKNVECVSLVGNGVSYEIDQIGETLPMLRDVLVHMVSYAANDAHLSYVVDKKHAENLVEVAHRALFAQRDVCDVFGPSWKELQDKPEDVLPERLPSLERPALARA